MFIVIVRYHFRLNLNSTVCFFAKRILEKQGFTTCLTKQIIILYNQEQVPFDPKVECT